MYFHTSLRRIDKKDSPLPSEPIPHPYPGVGGFQVHCEVEIEKDGVKSILKPYGPGVRPVHGQSHRWNIHGGAK